MTDAQFHALFGDALTCSDRDTFISDWTLSSVWGDAPDSDIPADRIDEIGRIWDVAHMTIRDIRKITGLSQARFAERYCIPRRSVENWESETCDCPAYLRLLLAKVVGAYDRHYEKEDYGKKE